MKDTVLSVRIPADLAESLDRRAESRGVGRSMMVREAVATYLGATPSAPSVEPMPIAAFLDAWRRAPRLADDEAIAFAADLREARTALPPLDDPWA
jgi:hypothetical protein